jgi:hypothetical protein
MISHHFVELNKLILKMYTVWGLREYFIKQLKKTGQSALLVSNSGCNYAKHYKCELLLIIVHG